MGGILPIIYWGFTWQLQKLTGLARCININCHFLALPCSAYSQKTPKKSIQPYNINNTFVGRKSYGLSPSSRPGVCATARQSSRSVKRSSTVVQSPEQLKRTNALRSLLPTSGKIHFSYESNDETDANSLPETGRRSITSHLTDVIKARRSHAADCVASEDAQNNWNAL